MNWAIVLSLCGQLSLRDVLRLRSRILTLKIAVHIYCLLILCGWAIRPLGTVVCILLFMFHQLVLESTYVINVVLSVRVWVRFELIRINLFLPVSN